MFLTVSVTSTDVGGTDDDGSGGGGGGDCKLVERPASMLSTFFSCFLCLPYL